VPAALVFVHNAAVAEWKDEVVREIRVHADSGGVLTKRHVVVLDTMNVVEAALVPPRFLSQEAAAAAAVEGSFLQALAKDEDNDRA
jgi:hypothetical protein